MKTKCTLRDYTLGQIQETKRNIDTILDDSEKLLMIESISKTMVNAFGNGNKILIAGNGGSAADAQHFAGELVSRFYIDRRPLPAIALTTDTSILTAIGNDYGFEHLFSRQVEAHGEKGDVFLAISTSGNSPNILNALIRSREMGIITVGLTGATGGKMNQLCDICYCVPADVTPRIQEIHSVVCHVVCSIIEESIFGEGFE